VTWTKLGDEYGDDCRDLSDAAFRTHTEALIWTMRRETGGHITARDVTRFAESPHAEMSVSELVNCGWWSVEGQGYRIHHHMEHQPEPDLLAKRREMTADRVRRHRRKKAGLEEDPASLTASFPSRPDPSRPDPGNAFGNASRNGVTEDWPEVARLADTSTSKENR
jgi:hypothetical protein